MSNIPTLKLTPINHVPEPQPPETNDFAKATVRKWREDVEAFARDRFHPRAKTVRAQRHTPRHSKKHARSESDAAKPPFIATFRGQATVCAGVLLLALGLKAIDVPATQSVSASVEQMVTTEIDLEEPQGALRFVDNLFSDTVDVWFEQKAPETLQSPFDGRLSQGYSLSCPGIEITGGKADVFASHDGKVTSVAQEEDGLYTVTIEHKGGLETLYGRLSAVSIEEGKKVKTGDAIGAASQSETGAYKMFWQVKRNATVVDPLSYIK